MAQPYIGEIRMFAGLNAPPGWMMCQGQILSISEYDALFNLIGTIYGGDGESTFALPDLRGRAPMHFNGTYPIGQSSGQEQVTLTGNQIPAHTHAVQVVGSPGSQVSPHGNLLAESYSVTPYINSASSGELAASSLVGVGGNEPHTNMQPFICMNYIISLFGVYPF